MPQKRSLPSFNNSVGATMVEHLVILPLFLILLAVALDFLRISYNTLSSQFIAARVMRESSTRLLSASDVQSRVVNLGTKLGVPIAAENISMCLIANHPCTGVTIGESGEIVVLAIDVPIQGFVFGSHYWQLSEKQFDLTAFVAGRMEPN